MQHFLTPDAKGLGLPFASAVRDGDLLYLSGAIGNQPGTLTLAAGGTCGGARPRRCSNIGATLEHCGLGFDDVVKFTIMLADMSEWARVQPSLRQIFRRLAGCRRAAPSVAAALRSARGSRSKRSPVTLERQPAANRRPICQSFSIVLAAASSASTICCSFWAVRRRAREFDGRTQVHHCAEQRGHAQWTFALRSRPKRAKIASTCALFSATNSSPFRRRGVELAVRGVDRRRRISHVLRSSSVSGR